MFSADLRLSAKCYVRRFLPTTADGYNCLISLTRRVSDNSIGQVATATDFFQVPSFLEFQCRMQQETSRSNCHTLLGVQAIPCDRIRDLLDGVPPDRFADLFPCCLQAVRDHGALASFERLGGRLLVALDGVQIHCSDTIHCAHCSVRHVGAHKRE